MHLHLLIAILVTVILSACSSKNGSGSSSLTLNLPTAEQLKAAKPLNAQKIAAADLDFAKACFMVSITGEGIVDSAKAKCDVPSGVFAGSAPPGGKLEIDVVKGTKRKIEVFAYFRSSASAPCVKHESINQFDPGSVARVGSKIADLVQDRENVDIDISLPAAGQTLVSQYGLPAFCASGTTTVLGEGSSRIVSARQSASTTHFKVESVVTGLATGPSLKTPSGISVRFSHIAKDKDTQ
jgi:hypothetical protein